jgi:hypothetical protein
MNETGWNHTLRTPLMVVVHTSFCRLYTLNNIVYLHGLKGRPRLPAGRIRTHLTRALEKCILDSLGRLFGQTSNHLHNILGVCSLHREF